MKIIFCFLLVLALTSVYAKSIGDIQLAEKNVSADPAEAQAQADNHRKYLEAMFKLHQAQIASQMWSIFNSK